MMENRNFIVFGLQPWDIPIGSTCKYTAIEISRKNRVLFVNPPVMRSSLLKNPDHPHVQKRKRILRKLEPSLIQESETLWVLYPRMVSESINWIPVHHLFYQLNYLNERTFAARIRHAMHELKFHHHPIILNDNSMLTGYFLKELLRPSLYIYLLRDAVTLVDYHRRHGTRMEPRLIAKSDLVVTNSQFFGNYAKKHNLNSHVIGQGCDVTMFSDADGSLPIPEEMKGFPRPVIGYTGALTTIRLDMGILEHVAKARPDWTLALVGPEDEAFQKSVLHQLPNVRFLGRKDPGELPGYVKSFDVAINPQVHNPITDVNYPLKIDEYLAMGKPVVATKTTFMDYFKDYTYLASTYDEWVQYLDRALREDSPEWIARRKALAGEHSWENFVNKIYTLSKKLEAKKRPPPDPHCDMVFTGLQSWHMAMGGNALNLAREFSRQHRVLYVNYAVDRHTLLGQRHSLAVQKYREVRKRFSSSIEHVSENLWVFTPDVFMESVARIRFRWIFDYLNALNMRRFGNSIKKAVNTLGFHDFILFNDSDFYRSFNLKEMLRPAFFLYYIRDNMIATDFFRFHGARMEEALIRKADMVAANSTFLAAYARKFNPYSFFVGQGCDLGLFDPDKSYEIPEDMKKIRDTGRLVVGYIGALNSIRIDLSSMEYIASNRPDWSLVLVGWEDDAFRRSPLHEMENVHFLGSKKVEELPGYVHAFDIAINLQVYNEVTRGNYPRKIDEYLAMGKPVVATRTDAMEMFAEYCFLGRTPEEYCQLIGEAHGTDSPELRRKRIGFAREHSWENNVRAIFNAIEKVRPT